MATAYAALTSLMHFITQLHEHPHPPIRLDEKQFDSLISNIRFFQRFLEDHHNTIDHGLEIRITDEARAAQVLIETHIADRIKDRNNFDGSVQKVTDAFDLMKKEALEVNWTEESRGNDQARKHHIPLPSPPPPPSAASGDENISVGIEDIAVKIVDRLTSQPKSDRQIISISGMGGIGKTTLARAVYHNKCVKNYFDISAWATISKDYYNTQQSLLQILHCLGWTSESKKNLSEMSEYDLGEQLYKYLIGRRYMIILDDVWDVEAWDRLRSYFPASHGSGIVITTRESAIASISSHNFAMDFLDKPKSWDLFCKNVFGEDCCPRELEDIGKMISNNCRGLPLSIVVIGGHLAKSPRTREYWKYVAENLSSVVNSENNEHCLKILSLSYDHLPVHLKPCFLYMGIFPEDKEISVSEIINLWMVEGILKPIDGRSLEEAAKEYLNDLIARNLILASGSLSARGKVKCCKIHDLLRDLCLKKETEKNFFRTVRKPRLCIREGNNELLISFDWFYEPMTRVRTLTVRRGSSSEQLSRGRGSMTVSENLGLVNLQSLVIENHCNYFRFISPESWDFFWNLQSLVIECYEEIKAPAEIWKMHQLRHIRIKYVTLPRPPSESNAVLKNLQSAKRMRNLSFSEDWVKRFPNVKKLEVGYRHNHKLGPLLINGGSAYALNNVARLEKLESFDCSLDSGMLRNVAFPHSLKKLSFNKLQWGDVTAKIGTLPELELLRLYGCSGREWKLVEGQFVRLKSLQLYNCRNLRCFTSCNNHFPCLQKLVLGGMSGLEEISSDIGDIPTLRSIELRECADSAVVSAKQIAEEQCKAGNEELQIKVFLAERSILSSKSFFSASNFHVVPFYNRFFMKR